MLPTVCDKQLYISGSVQPNTFNCYCTRKFDQDKIKIFSIRIKEFIKPRKYLYQLNQDIRYSEITYPVHAQYQNRKLNLSRITDLDSFPRINLTSAQDEGENALSEDLKQ